MKYVVIREDDITPFTRRDMLERLYEDFFKRGFPVNLSVIPHISTDIRYDGNSPYSPYKKFLGMKYSPMIPPDYRGKNVERSFEGNPDLLNWIGTMGGNIEILQHGFDHNHHGGRNEFAIYDRELIISKITAGRKIIQQFLKTTPKFFVAPSDSISFTTLKALKQSFKGISLWRFNILKNILGGVRRNISSRVLYDDFIAFLKIRGIKSGVFRWDDFVIFEHQGYIFSRFATPEDIESNFMNIFNNNEIIIVVNHYWEYFFDWDGLDEELFRIWKKVMSSVFERDDCRILTFSQLYEELDI